MAKDLKVTSPLSQTKAVTTNLNTTPAPDPTRVESLLDTERTELTFI